MNNFLEKFKSISEDYFKAWSNIKDAYKDELNSPALISERGYTPHNYDNHCINIYDILGQIIPDSFYTKYNKGENIFILALAVLLHDLSMTRDVSDDSRKSHAYISTKEIIDEILTDKKTVLKTFVPDRDFIEPLCDVIIAHSDRKIDPTDTEKTLDTILSKYADSLPRGTNENINVPLLAGLLRIADELDIAHNRIAHTGYEKKHNIEDSSRHYFRCELFKKICIDANDKRKINLQVESFKYDRTPDKIKSAGEIIAVYEKIKQEFENIYSKIFSQHKYTLADWTVDRIILMDEEKYLTELKKKEKL